MAHIEEYLLAGVKNPMEKKRTNPGFHDLKPTIWVGKQGMTDTILDEIKSQIKVRKVIKIKWLSSVEIEPESIATQSRTKLLQVRGRTMILGDPQLFR